MTIPLLISTLLSPLVGLLNDLYGQRVRLLNLSIVSLVIGMGLFKVHMVLSLVFMGI